MPILPGDLPVLRSTPQTTKLYLVVQQPQTYSGGAWANYFSTCPLSADATGDPVVTLNVTGAWTGGAQTLRDGQTIFIGTAAGQWDKGITRYRGDDVTIGGAPVLTIDIAPSSELGGAVAGDYVTILDEFRVWNRYPRITNAGGVLSWYKDYDVAYNDLGADAATRRQGAMPAVPIMGPHAVRFIEIGGSAEVYFDWSDSYAMAPGGTVNAWASGGEDGGAGWSSAVQTPGFQTYSNVSGLAGYQTRLILGTDLQDPDEKWRRGYRYVFTLRRPGETQGGDPANAEPIINFQVQGMSGDFSSGRWRAGIRVFGSDASEHVFIPGALVVLFAEDDYSAQPAYMGSGPTGVGPIYDREEIVLIGHIADGSVTQDSETGEVSFEIVSLAEQTSRRENYPVPIEYSDVATEWYETPTLTLNRAVWHYVVWHSTIATISDFYMSGELDIEIKATDFLAGNLYATVDSFLSARRFARLLVDRFERCQCAQDIQTRTYGAAPTLLTLAATDWIDKLNFREVNEKRTNFVELGGVFYDAGQLRPLLSNAPGDMGGYGGTPESSTNLAITAQTDVNELAGRVFAARNSRWPQATIEMAGNWRVGDLWPQEYIYITTTTERYTFVNTRFILRGISYEYDRMVGALFVTYSVELETEGTNGITVTIPAELPLVDPPPIPTYPPYNPPAADGSGVVDDGRRMVVTDVGVFVTDNIYAASPTWYGINDGLVTATDLDGYSIKKNPFHWQTGDKSLYIGTGTGLWKMDVFPTGEWVQVVALASINAWAGTAYGYVLYTRLNFNIEFENRIAFCCYYPGGIGANKHHFFVVQDGVITSWYCPWPCGGNRVTLYGDIKFAQHSAGQTIYAAQPSYDIGAANTRLHKTIDAGLSWAHIATAPVNGQNDSLSIPYVDVTNVTDSFVLFGNKGGFDIGVDGAYSTIPGTTGTEYTKMGTGGHPDYIWLLQRYPHVLPCKWSNDRGVTWNELPVIGGVSAPTVASYVTWVSGVVQEVLVGFEDGTVWMFKQGAWSEKTGNLLGFLVTEIRGIERDTL